MALAFFYFEVSFSVPKKWVLEKFIPKKSVTNFGFFIKKEVITLGSHLFFVKERKKLNYPFFTPFET